MKQLTYMNYKIIIFVSILFALASCRPFTTTLSSSRNKAITENETEENIVEPKKKDYFRIPSGPIDDETAAKTNKKKDNFSIPSGPMDTEELLIAQAKSAAKEQALKRAEMAGKRKAAEAAKNETGSTALRSDIPRIDQLEDKQAKNAAKELLAKRAAMARAKRMELAKIKEREDRLVNRASEEELKRVDDLRLAEEKAKKEARLLALQKERLEKIKAEAIENAAIAVAKAKELERLEQESLEEERLELERITKENVEREARNAAAIAAAKTEEERIKREKIAEAEAAAAADKAEADRLEREQIAKEEIAILNAKAEADRLEREQIAKEEIAIAKAKAEADRLEKERITKEEIAIAKAKEEADRLEKERITKEEIAIAKAKEEADRLEKERITKEEMAIAKAKEEADRLEKERIATAKAKEEARQKAVELAAAKQAEMKAEEKRKKNLATAATNTETIINEDARTIGTEEIEETEKEKAARYARQTLAIQKEGDKKTGWLLSKKESRKTFDNESEDEVKIQEPIVPREAGPKPERMLTKANIPISIADMDRDPALSKVNNVPPPALKKYYFPIQNLETAKAYCFVSGGSTIDTTYWLMKSLSFGGKSYLITEKYDHNFVMTSSSRERINELGAYVEDYTAYENSGLGGSIAVEYWVEDDEGFKWNMDDGFAMVSMNFNSNDFPNYDITAYRERHLINSNATYDFENKTLAAVVLEDRQTTVYVDNKNNEESYPSSYENYFAEGVGLVKFTINKRDKGFTLARTYILSHIIPYENWQQISK
jgi:hypothetical protein